MEKIHTAWVAVHFLPGHKRHAGYADGVDGQKDQYGPPHELQDHRGDPVQI
jgi:hypothetical protein